MPNNSKIILNSIFNLPTPASINYNWNMGSLLGISLGIQIISGILISIHYTSSTSEAFERVIHITRDVNNG
jgi:quinol-cytochrome oxidoreductase complex cytochrome b subunit